MVNVTQAKEIALKEMPDMEVVKSVKYKDYYIFFMQPDGIDVDAPGAMMDSYVFVNMRSGKVEYHQIWDFEDFLDNVYPA